MNQNLSIQKNVGYVYSRELLSLSNRLPPVKGRAILVHQLIAAYNLLDHCYRIEVDKPLQENQLRKFHSIEFLDYVRKISANNSDELNDDDDENDFGINYDCPPFADLFKTIGYLAASSIAAANAIITKQFSIVLNWFGGWHHGHRDEASGFCYTNDIVFAILTFLENGFDKILYIDLDLHHGNGVEHAFAHTDKVFCLSFHKYEFGFFPDTGNIDDIGSFRGKYHSINMTLRNGINDDQYIEIFDKIINKLIPKYKPQVIICQCGADGLSGDRMKSFNLTSRSYLHCIEKLLSINLPLIILGGGGYNYTNTAKLWTLITAKVLNQQLDSNIPDHNFFLYYGPDYDLSITESMLPNENDPKEYEEKLKIIFKNIEKIPAFVPLRPTPDPNNNGSWIDKFKNIINVLEKNRGEDAMSMVLSILSAFGVTIVAIYTAFGMFSWPVSLIKGTKSARTQLQDIEDRHLNNSFNINSLREKLRTTGQLTDREMNRLRILEEQERMTNLEESFVNEYRESYFYRLDKAFHSLGMHMGYALVNSTYPNPINFILSELQTVYPLDYILILSLSFSLVMYTISGFKHIGIRFLCIKLYKIKPGKTAPQGILLLFASIMLAILGINVLFYSAFPQYATYGRQFYQEQTSNNTYTAKICNLDSPKDSCTMTRMSALLLRFFYKAWFFGAYYYWMMWTFLIVSLCSFVYVSLRPKQTVTQGLLESEFENENY
uniref:histone deacetylase n=1 Tax=Dermatophagoides pteronyssinus TaxID=6956 RepID=A0A6P6XXR9_DERPT|nr:histone deacetylase 8-like isoform X1 [Dermatophagoides pteronyssinus]